MISAFVSWRVSLNGDSLRAMKDLVGVGVADAAEEMRIGQRAFQRVALLLKRRRECRGAARHHLEPAGIE